MNKQALEIAFKKGFVKCAMEKYAFGVQDISNFLTDHNIDPQWAGAGVGALGGGLLGGLFGPEGHKGKAALLGALGGGAGGYYGGGKFNEAFPGHPLAPYRDQVKNSPQDQQALSPLKSLEDPSLISSSSNISPYGPPTNAPRIPSQANSLPGYSTGSNRRGGGGPFDDQMEDIPLQDAQPAPHPSIMQNLQRLGGGITSKISDIKNGLMNAIPGQVNPWANPPQYPTIPLQPGFPHPK
jgi:hypothetical protein